MRSSPECDACYNDLVRARQQRAHMLPRSGLLSLLSSLIHHACGVTITIVQWLGFRLRRREASHIHLQRRDKRLLQDVDLPILAHLFFTNSQAFGLLCRELNQETVLLRALICEYAFDESQPVEVLMP
jgi:hypothetical protein